MRVRHLTVIPIVHSLSVMRNQDDTPLTYVTISAS